nr:MAG TPA: hypothetical protein [Caudoviricetes sp.]
MCPFWRRQAVEFVSFNFKKTFFGSTPNAALNLKMVAVATRPRMIAWLLIS